MARADLRTEVGTDFLATVPREPGIYRMYDAAGGLFYVGKARNLGRRLAQYRTARRTKKSQASHAGEIGRPHRVAGLRVVIFGSERVAQRISGIPELLGISE